MRIPLTIGFCLAQSAWAAAIYTTTASSTFTISAHSVVLGPVPGTVTEFGAGTASFSAVASPSGIFPATKTVGVAGTAPSPVSFAASTKQAGHIFAIDNTSGAGTIVAPFTFTYSWDVMISAGAPPNEWATAGAFFHITGIDNEILRIGGVSVSEYLHRPSYETILGDTGGVGAVTVTGTIEVPGGVFSAFSVITDTAGTAASVPEPASAFLAAGGLAWLALRRRRR